MKFKDLDPEMWLAIALVCGFIATIVLFFAFKAMGASDIPVVPFDF